MIGGTIETNTHNLAGNFVNNIDASIQTGSLNFASHTPAFWGDVPTHSISSVINTTETDTTFQHDTSGGNWVIGFTSNLEVDTYNGSPGSSAHRSRSVSLTPVTGTLAVDTTTRLAGDADNELTTDYGYDSYGNRTSTNLTGAHIASRTATAGSFIENRYPSTLQNAVNHSTTINSYDLRFGAPKQVTDPNGLIASRTFDAFGRMVTSTDVDGVITTIDYDNCASVGCSTVNGVSPAFRVVTSSAITPTLTEYYDRLGRLIRSEAQDFGSGTIVQDIQYDNLGRISQYSLPYISGGSVHNVTRQYDIRNRVTTEMRPDGGSTNIGYSAVGSLARVSFTENVKESNGSATDDTQTKVSDYNAYGQLVSTIDASGTSDSATTTYTYDGDSNPLTVTVNGGSDGSAMSTFAYDAAGNRTQLTGPNVGTITSNYNALGQIRSNTDNRNQNTTWTYDLLGRQTSRVDADGTATWTYDPAGAKGLLSSRTNGSGAFTETYVYSDPGRAARLSRITTDIMVPGFSKTYHRDYTYDSDGRLDTADLPSGLTIRQQYNTRGYLSAILDDSNSTALQTFNQAGQFGVTQETYGNGVVTTRSFDPMSGRLETIDTTKTSTVIQDLDYAWRSNGTLESRLSVTDAGDNREEVFTYDGLNRLEKAKTYLNNNPQRDLDYSYNKLGNLISKTSTISADTQATGYQYGTSTNAGPHAVSQVTLNGVSTTLSYDANGAITQYDYSTGPDTFIEYNAANQPTTIVVGTSLTDTNPEGKDEFNYGPDGERYYKKSTYLDNSSVQQIQHTFYVGEFEESVLATDTNTNSIQKTRVGDNILHIKEQPTTGSAIESFEYLHRDHLGGVNSITDETGHVLQQLAFEPYGSRKQSDWLSNLNGTEEQTLLDSLNTNTSRGYTGHEHLDRTGFIHMNGRVYDPKIGRFLSPDPIVQAPTNSQSWNRYTYAFNSPLSYTDPSGFESYGAAAAQATFGGSDNGDAYRGGPSTVGHFSPGNHDFPYLPDGSVWLFYNSSTITAEEYQGGTNVVPTGAPVDLDDQEVFFGELEKELVVDIAEAVVDEFVLAPIEDAVEGKILSAVCNVAKICRAVQKVVEKVLGKVPDRLPDDTIVVRGGADITPESIVKGTGKHPSAGVEGFSVETKAGACITDLCKNVPNNQVGVTTVGDIRAKGGDVIPTSGRSPNHATVTGLDPNDASDLLSPSVPNTVPKSERNF